ncbi:coproporphyrinogen III oxidase [Bacillus sp. FJAT-18017]|uniref:coproporphyrinogen III oxidase n=1 Tax=Bacillus sp. FJAT-18017 TaxID=1705566 RepID=UPI0006ADD700|nr:coproporphyrinogen III oxidase [Bacillus sp. FJAT-18017]ALC91957.1 coproporphyrinogen III oxidase [Bacillus sp. FJAT-18017]
MHISITGLSDQRFERPLQLIANLFFEESHIYFNKIDNADISIEISLEQIETEVTVTGILDSNVPLRAEHRAVIDLELSEKEQFKQLKNAVSHVYLMLLQELTGMTQKWGILTGVRPTKLLHRKLREGADPETAQKELAKEHMITPEKAALMQRIVDRQLAAVPDLYSLKKEVSIYIGIPFCPTKCAYCTFPAYAINGRQGSVNSFLGGLHFEMKQMGSWLKEKGIKITTVYFGGGTPTSITAEEMDMLYEEMYTSFPDATEIREVTVEAGRPDTITPEKLEVLKKWNINRISINPQSYIQETLKAIGRHHTVEETVDKFKLAREMGMDNINMDLIIGLPGEGTKEFTYTLNETEKLMPESLTVHTLSFKRASEMTKNKDKYRVADRGEVEKMMELAETWTKEHGYEPYYLYRQKNILGNLENVGYSFPGQESIYNIIIMEEMQTIIGLGCGASSKFVHPVTGVITHFANPKDPKSYNDNFEHYTNEKIKILEDLFSEANEPASI